MSFPKSALPQTATYWQPESYDGFGDPTFEDPEEISCRYENTNEIFIDGNGQEAHSRAIVYSLTEMRIGGYLYLGESVEPDPEDVDGTDRIRRVDATPDIKNRKTLYKAYL